MQSLFASCTKRTSQVSSMNVCFSNRPLVVKRFQTIHHYRVDVTHGLVSHARFYMPWT